MDKKEKVSQINERIEMYFLFLRAAQKILLERDAEKKEAFK